MHQNNNIMATLNTKLYTFDELKYKPYYQLFQFVDGLKTIIFDFEDEIESLEMMEAEQGYLTSEMTESLNTITTQLDYVTRNLKTAITALDFKATKSFFNVEGIAPICLN